MPGLADVLVLKRRDFCESPHLKKLQPEVSFMDHQVMCAGCGKLIDSFTAQSLDNGSPACAECVRREDEILDAQINYSILKNNSSDTD